MGVRMYAQSCDTHTHLIAAEGWKRRVGIVVDAMVLLLVVGLTVLFGYYVTKLLRIYTCTGLVQQLVPFGLSVAVRSIFPGVPIIILMYFAFGACGRPTR